MRYLISFVVLAGLAGCFWTTPQVWSGILYPDKSDLTKHVSTGDFGSLEECRDATLAAARARELPISKFDYECGLNCSESKYGTNVCKETKR